MRYDLEGGIPTLAVALTEHMNLDELKVLATLTNTRAPARKAELVKLRFFAGLTNEQAANLLGITARTAYADWGYAKAWLRLEMS